MDKYISAEIVLKILDDKGTDIEAIVRCYDFPPTIRLVSPLYSMFTHNSTEYICSYDLYKMYIAIIFYLKVQLNPNTDTVNADCERAEYDLGYAQYHLMKKFEAEELDEAMYDEKVCHAYEKCILKLLFLLQTTTVKNDEQLDAIKNAVLTMNDETLVKLGYVSRLSNFKTPTDSAKITDEHRARVEYYTTSVTATPEESA